MNIQWSIKPLFPIQVTALPLTALLPAKVQFERTPSLPNQEIKLSTESKVMFSNLEIDITLILIACSIKWRTGKYLLNKSHI